MAFSQLIWADRKAQFAEADKNRANNSKDNYCFFDRGLADVTAYLNHTLSPQPNWEAELKSYPYDIVFLIAPVEEIYQKDESRMESFQQARSLHQAIKESYQALGPFIEVPFLSPEERCAFILKHCNEG